MITKAKFKYSVRDGKLNARAKRKGRRSVRRQESDSLNQICNELNADRGRAWLAKARVSLEEAKLLLEEQADYEDALVSDFEKLIDSACG